MELIRINDNKLKIMLTSLDMKNYALDAQTLSCGTEETRRAFRSILHDAGVGSGFEDGKDKIYVQYYPSREGGCEMFVTKIALMESETAEQHLHSDATPLPITGSKSERVTSPAAAYRYDTLPLLLHACRHAHKVLSSTRHKPSSAAYQDDCGKFYLTIDGASIPTNEPETLSALNCLLGEFGSSCTADDLASYIAEHATPLCRAHALETLGEL